MKAYFSCGGGDFIAIESFLTMAEKESITEFILFTRSAKYIIPLIKLHPIWKNLKITVPLTEKQIMDYGVYSFYHIPHLKKVTKRNWSELSGDVKDCSGEIIYRQILREERPYTESLFHVKQIDCDIVIDKHSGSDDRLIKKGRSLKFEEMMACVGDGTIVLNQEKMSMEESLGYVKGCKSFLGIDSMMSVWGARQNLNHMRVKSINKIFYKWLPIYDPFGRMDVYGL